jgi:hypothetical protein
MNRCIQFHYAINISLYSRTFWRIHGGADQGPATQVDGRALNFPRILAYPVMRTVPTAIFIFENELTWGKALEGGRFG